MTDQGSVSKRHVFIVGAKCIGQYGGYETFLDKLTEQHQGNKNISILMVVQSLYRRSLLLLTSSRQRIRRGEKRIKD